MRAMVQREELGRWSCSSDGGGANRENREFGSVGGENGQQHSLVALPGLLFRSWPLFPPFSPASVRLRPYFVRGRDFSVVGLRFSPPSSVIRPWAGLLGHRPPFPSCSSVRTNQLAPELESRYHPSVRRRSRLRVRSFIIRVSEIYIS